MPRRRFNLVLSKFNLIITLVTIVSLSSAIAAIEKPQFRAGLKIKKISEKPEIYQNFKKTLNLGKEKNIELLMVLDNLTQKPRKMILNLGDEKSEFKITSQKSGTCGEIKYQAEFINNQPVDRLFGYTIHLTLNDHVKNHCRKPENQKWEATLTLEKRITKNGVTQYKNAGKVLFAGNPVRIMTWN